MGNRTSKTEFAQGKGPVPAQLVSNYSYDAIYELTQAVLNGATSETYSYDAVGNRLSSLGVSPYTYNSSNELTSKPLTPYSYDNDGNTVGKSDQGTIFRYRWDFENRLLSVEWANTSTTCFVLATFTYDPFGRRIKKDSCTNPGTATAIYLYDGDNVIEELDGSGAPVARYTQGLGIDEPLAMYRAGVASYYQADGLGSIEALTNSTGTVAASYVYDSFGNLTASTGTITNPFRYTGRELDAETGLYYYRARYYDPSTGRFLSEDPIQFTGSINFYTYVQNNPTNAKDPTGLKIRICSRGGFQETSPSGIGNHAYLYDTRNGDNCGRGNNSGKENPSSPGTVCVDVPNSEGREDGVMKCCRENRNKGIFFPPINDCQTLVDDCLKKAGLSNPGVPGGRIGCRGEPCKKLPRILPDWFPKPVD